MPQPFTIYVMQSAHTDIGYTHPQEQIADMYLDHYDLVLDLCRQHETTPLEHRFKWTCETFWQVQNYLENCPERLDEFLHYVRAGMIEVTAVYLHFTDLIDADAYQRSIELATAFRDQHQAPIRSAMHCDINGWPWAMADILAEAAIPFFCSQVHIDSATDPLGNRGSLHYHWLLEMAGVRPDAPIRIPQAFWWEGPNGGRVLHWLNEHYLLGNVLGVSSPQGFHADKTRYFFETDSQTVDDLYNTASREVPRYVERLQANGYAYPMMLLSTGGYYVDNSRPDGRWCKVIERWNAEHTDIVMRTATLSEWFDALGGEGTADLPVYRTAWPDHWAHGLGSTTARMAQARRTQRRRPAVIALTEKAGENTKAARYLDKALHYERFALEHTFDAWSTTARPEALANDFQHVTKELAFHRAELYLDEAANAALRSLIDSSGGEPRLHVYSTGPAGMRTVHFNSGDTKVDPAQQMLVGSDGQPHPFQADFARLSQFVATLPIEPDRLISFRLTPRSEKSSRTYPTDTTTLDSEAWRLRIDPHTGGLVSLVEQTAQREWVDADQRYTFGQLVHEAVIHPLGREAVGNAARLAGFGALTEEAAKRFTPGPIVDHTVLTITAEPWRTYGDVFDAISLSGSAERIGDVIITWRVYQRVPLVELVLDWNKRWSDLPESAYVAFPFATRTGSLQLQTGGGFFQPGSHDANGQLPGTCSTYYTIQDAARITDQAGHLFWLPLDAPLVMTNAINYSNWETDPWQWNGFLASMPVNHYWHTNFPTSQRGFIRLRYRLISGAESLPIARPLDAMGWR